MNIFVRNPKNTPIQPSNITKSRTFVDGLLPSDIPSRKELVDRQLPSCARNWGRFIDTTQLLPGDLILTRSIAPDAISRKISAAQKQGGLADNHSQWTHAAVYLGDGEHICESSFKEAGFKWGVNIRSLFDYCNGEYAIRVRRPKVQDNLQRIRIAIGAMSLIGNKYSFFDIIKLRRAASGTKGFWYPGKKTQSLPSKALICSTLYQDAYSFSFQGMRILHGHMATPAHLSASTDFDPIDPKISWLEIQ